MTKSQALAEAKKRWGKASACWMRKTECIGFRYAVGLLCIWDGPETFCERGTGTSWELAFADADRREKGEGT